MLVVQFRVAQLGVSYGATCTFFLAARSWQLAAPATTELEFTVTSDLVIVCSCSGCRGSELLAGHPAHRLVGHGQCLSPPPGN